MAEVEPWQWIIGTVVTLLLGYLTYRGATFTASRTKEGVERTAEVSAQDSALDAWRELVEPYRQETRDLRDRLTDQVARVDRLVEDHESERKDFNHRLEVQAERVDLLTMQVKHWKRTARVMARFAGQMRDEVLRLGGTIPATPDELLLIQQLDDEDN